MNRNKLLILVIILCALIQNSAANSSNNSQIGYTRADNPISKNTNHMAGCDTNQNNTIVTAIEMVLEKTNGGIACAAEGGDWFWVSLKSGHTFTAAIWDGQAQVYFNLYDATGAHLLAQDDDSGNITYTNDGEQIITILLKAYNETNPESEIRYTFKPRIEKQL